MIRAAPKVRPASEAKKRHHFIPITYLDGFAGPDGRLQVYLCDIGGEPKPIAPPNIAYQNYYYSQPTPDGGQDNLILEGLFDVQVEAHWPAAREAARADRWTPETWSRLYLMMASLRARVPAARELIESSLSASVRMAAQALERGGRIDPLPEELNGSWDNVVISIDPNRSLQAMPQLLEAVNQVQEMVGFEILHNKTERPFITSDNPVAWFDPRVPEARRLPYTIDRVARKAEIQFPIDPWTLLRGSTALIGRQQGGPPLSRTVTDETVVRRCNRITAQYAYRLAFGLDRSSDRVIGLYADRSPVLKSRTVQVPRGDLLWLETVFGPRPQLPKWPRAPKNDVAG